MNNVQVEWPGDRYVVDLIHLPEATSGEKYGLVLIDSFTRMVVLRALKSPDAESVAKELYSIYMLLGVPKYLQSDNGPEFLNAVIYAFNRLMGVIHKHSVPYHPQTNGKVERVNRLIRDTINKMLLEQKREWPIYTDYIQFLINCKFSEAAGSLPYSILFGRRPNDLVDYTQLKPKPIGIDEWKEHQDRLISIIYPAIKLRQKNIQEKRVKFYNNLRAKVMLEDLPPKTQVMIQNPELLGGSKNKNKPKFLGPYTIVQRTRQGPYLLQDLMGNRYNRLVPIEQIKPLRTLPIDDSHVEGDRWVVKKILNHHKNARGELTYEVQWKGWDETTWEPVAYLDQCGGLISKYWASKR
jgi:transposase InsO family protein